MAKKADGRKAKTDENHKKNKGGEQPRYQKPKKMKVMGPRPDSYAPNPDREQARQEEEYRARMKQRLEESMNKLTLLGVHYPALVAGEAECYTLGELRGDNFLELHDFEVYDQGGATYIMGSETDGNHIIPHKWLFRKEEHCKFQNGEIGFIEKTMLRFLKRVLAIEIETVIAERRLHTDSADAFVANSAAPAVEPHPVRLATNNGELVDTPSARDTNVLNEDQEVHPFAHFKLDQSIGSYEANDGDHRMVISQRIRKKRMTIKVESLDDGHRLAVQGLTVDTIISTRLVDDADALRAFLGQPEHPGRSQKLAFAGFIRQLITARDKAEARKAA